LKNSHVIALQFNAWLKFALQPAGRRHSGKFKARFLSSFIILFWLIATLWPMPKAYAATDVITGSATYFTVPLAGATEIPGPGDPDGLGTIMFVLDPGAGTVCYTLETMNISEPTMAHIHKGAEDEEGPIFISLFEEPSDASLSGCVAAEPEDIIAIIDNPANFYANIHNVDFPAGAIRGQLQQEATVFTVTLENISGKSNLPTPFSPVVYAVHDATTAPFFDTGEPDRGLGLEGVAEDGAAAMLAASVAADTEITSSGVAAIPVGASDPGPLFPGNSYQFQIAATPGDNFSIASMLVQTNDIFVAPADNGIALFDENGAPIQGNLATSFPLWDAGTEVNEAPGMGPNQAPRQSAPNIGGAEGVVTEFENTTRGLPLPQGIVDITVTENDGTFTFAIVNDSANLGAYVTPLGPIFYATHSLEWRLFTTGEDASPGLEVLAEDGSPAGLVGETSGAPGTGEVGAQPITVERPDDPPGPAGQGETFRFDVTPTIAYPYVSIASMAVESNDAFLAFDEKGIKLLDPTGSPLPVEVIQADINRKLAVWDAGTEANEPPGVGPTQAPRQAAANTGPVDPISGVRLYSDETNDLAGSLAGGFAAMTIEFGDEPLSFVVTIKNTSDSILYPGILSPVAYVIHTDQISLFEVDEPASPALEALAEDGNTDPLATLLADSSEVLDVDVAGGGAIQPGDQVQFTVTPNAAFPYLTIGSMIVPSNDAFLAFGPEGLLLIDEATGQRRSLDVLAEEIAAELIAWDAGTERNQASAAGPDQAPRQAGPNTGRQYDINGTCPAC